MEANNIHQELQGREALARGNPRVNYPLKKALCIIKEQELFDMEDPMVSFAVSWLTINISKVGSENFVNSWNHHRIPGEWWYFMSESHAL